jgi:hypothetical protein
MSGYGSLDGPRGSSFPMVLLAATALLSATAAVLGGIALHKASRPAAHPAPAPAPVCDPTGFFKCTTGSFCVGIQGHPQNTDGYYTSTSNGIEFDRLVFLPNTTAGSAPGDYFIHMSVHGGCDQKPCGFNENELYTQVPGTGLYYEGFTVNRTGAVLGDQVFYETLYFAPDCSGYHKIVKGQLVAGAPAAVMCRNFCSRIGEKEYTAGIQGGVKA